MESGDTTVNLYVQWRKNVLTIKYHINNGSVSSSGYSSLGSLVYDKSTLSTLKDEWTYNEPKTNGLYNATTFGLTRKGYKFMGWSTNTSGTIVFDQDDTSIIPTNLSNDIKTGDCTIKLYAVWVISGVVYIDNGVTLEPYLIYIDDGEKWNSYLAYVDNGTSWSTIS